MANKHMQNKNHRKNRHNTQKRKVVETTLRPERMLHRAMALARLEPSQDSQTNQAGQIALVQGALPTELVRVQLTKVKGVLQGRVLDVLEASPFRRTLASHHPGLDYAFIDDEQQLVLKAEVIKDIMNRQGVNSSSVDTAMKVRPAPELWNYRYAVQPAVSKEGLGYRKAQSHELVLLNEDSVAHPAINEVWNVLENSVGQETAKGLVEIALRANHEGEVLACLIGRASHRNYMALAHELVDGGVLAGVSYSQYDARGRFRNGVERLAGKRRLPQVIGDAQVSVSASEFSQPNPKAAGLLFQTLKTWIEELEVTGEAVDLFGGSGVIAFHLRELFEKVKVVDISGSSLKLGEQEAEKQGISNLEFKKVNAKYLNPEEISNLSLLCVDPPRAGLSKELRSAISHAKPSYLAYVSCDVATWARDVASLNEQGFELIKMEAFDFYPQTHHIEMLSLLKCLD